MSLALASFAVLTCTAEALPGEPIAGSPIQHVIVLIQENRTFDNLFASSIVANGGPFPGANTSQTTTVDGQTVHLKETPFEFPADPSHSHAALLGEWNHGKMDGFANVYVTTVIGAPKPAPGFAYAYLPDYETSIYHLLAARYALADDNFAPRLVPTFPSHYTLMTAQSRIAGNPNASVWGCDSAPGTIVPVFGEGESIAPGGIFPCFDQPTIADLLDQARVTWKYYTGAYDDLSDPAVNIFDAFRRVRYGPEWTANVKTPSGTILADIQNCRLPQVAYATPNWLDSDHAGNLSAAGPGWVGSIYLAIVQSQHNPDPACNYYKNSAIIVTWDDSGGWYDHVKPPAGPDGTTWGFRIPIIVVSAWAHNGVSHTQRESTSITRFIERNFALGNLGERDVSDDDLSDMFDYARAQPIPSFTVLGMDELIHRSRFDLVAAESNDHIVDDDR